MSDSSFYALSAKPSLSLIAGGDKLLADNASWSSAFGQAVTVTYGFRASAPSGNAYTDIEKNAFARVDNAEIAAIRYAISAWSDVANIRFTDAGSTNNAAILFSNYDDDDGAAGYAYQPVNRQSAASSNEGDVWLNTFDGGMTDLQLGTNDYNTIIHELGHAIGLSHPGAYNAGETDNINYAGNAEFVEDSLQYTVMSYFDAKETGANHGELFATTPLLLDIVAIQKLYGANTTATAGNDVYGFNSTRGALYSFANAQDKKVLSIWDAAGTDTLDVSGYTMAQVVSLAPGSFSDVGGLTKNISIAPGAVIENLIAGSGNDILTGNAANNSIDGGIGFDRMIFTGKRSEYTLSGTITQETVNDTIAGRDGSDHLLNVERLKFTDQVVALDINGNAGQAYRLYKAALDRTPDAQGLAGWIKYMDDGGNLTAMAQMFIGSSEFTGKYGQLDNSGFVTRLYLNVLARNGETEGINGWVNGMNNGLSRAQVLEGFSESGENQANVLGLIRDGIGYTEWWLS